ncbi:MAG: CDP-2,3-bis-(O-geranylgeranyl)-sn-glycerol synthase [Candidatus Heimdallarchaeota archaeon]|nr:MAG: CDP-2,3-bis-(O-geranylgeranyl)-sn-glycerol synthase [Candidatus Heimdallarchaeota archaeon]
MAESLIQVILDSTIFVLPLWFGNAIPTLLGGGPPIDGGRYWSDGKRILGDGKTIRGFWTGTIFGGVVGGLIAGLITLLSTVLPVPIYLDDNLILRLFYQDFLESGILFQFFSRINLRGFFSNSILLGFSTGLLMAFGGLIGDLIGSFIKRRSGIERGHPFIFLDQLGFLVLGMIFVYPLIPWDIEWILVQVPITFVVHIAANLFGYFTGIQDEPL